MNNNETSKLVCFKSYNDPKVLHTGRVSEERVDPICGKYLVLEVEGIPYPMYRFTKEVNQTRV